MLSTDYIAGAIRTEAPWEDEALQRRLKTCTRLIHSVLGLSTELGELAETLMGKPDRNHIREEIGDCLWYCAIFCDYVHFTFEDAMAAAEVDWAVSGYGHAMGNWLAKFVGETADIVKRLVFYGKGPEEAGFTLKRIGLVLLCLRWIASTYELDWDSCMAVNLNKLRKRYPEKFNETDAVKRDLVAEQHALSQDPVKGNEVEYGHIIPGQDRKSVV